MSLPSLEYRRDSSEYGGLGDLPRTLQLFALATVAAILSAVPMFLSLAVNQGLLILLSGLLLGLALSYPLTRVFKTMRLRKRRIAFAVTIYASLLAVALVHLGFYLRDVGMVYHEITNRYSRLAGAFPIARGGPFTLYNLFIQREVGQGGFTGYAIYRLRNNFYSTSTFVLAVLTPYTAWRICKRQLNAAYCTSCSMWMGNPRNVAVVPAAFREFLVETVQSNDIEKALALTRVVADVPLGTSCAIARSYRCPSCGSLVIDVVQNRYSRRKQSQFAVLPPMSVSQEFTDALRSDPVLPVDSDTVEGESRATEANPPVGP